MKLAIIFPGQGSQEVGMASELFEEFKAVRDIFFQADETLHFPLSKLILEGPFEKLTLTENAQPAILTASYAIWILLREFMPKGAVCAFAGHSLGEYTALCASGALAFSDAVRLVHLRGKFMQEAVPAGEGMMIAVLGLPLDKVKEILESPELKGEVVDIANVNSPEQVVLSGAREAVERCKEPLKKSGAKRVIELNVSAPFHSRLMKPAAERLTPYLKNTQFSLPEAPVFSNATIAPYPDDLTGFSELLIRQICEPVRWVEEVVEISRLGPDAFVEVGPGRVLRGLTARILPGTRILGVSSIDEFKSILPILTGEINI